MKISKVEAEHLATLWDRANTDETDIGWRLVKSFMKRLGSKYKFDPEQVSISKLGYVHKLKWCSKCHDLATGINGTDFVRYRVTATGKWAKQPVCPACIAKHFPEFHKVQNF